MPFEISEFKAPHVARSGSVAVLPRPATQVQPPIALVAGQSRRSARLGATTSLVRFYTTEDVRVRVYPEPEGVTDTTVAVADGSDGLSEFFPAGETTIGILHNAGRVRLAVIPAA